MIRTALCDLLRIEYPMIQAGMGEFTSAEMVAAVSIAGGLGSLGCDYRTIDDVTRQLAAIRELINRPFASSKSLTYLMSRGRLLRALDRLMKLLSIVAKRIQSGRII